MGAFVGSPLVPILAGLHYLHSFVFHGNFVSSVCPSLAGFRFNTQVAAQVTAPKITKIQTWKLMPKKVSDWERQSDNPNFKLGVGLQMPRLFSQLPLTCGSLERIFRLTQPADGAAWISCVLPSKKSWKVGTKVQAISSSGTSSKGGNLA